MDAILLTERSIIDNFSTDFTKEVIFKLDAFAENIDGNFLRNQVEAYKKSGYYRTVVDSYRYYNNDHDILKNDRKGLSNTGELVPIKNVPNHHDIDNQFAKCVDQKRNYSFGRPIVFNVDDDNEFQRVLDSSIGSRKMTRRIKKLALDAILAGVSYLYPYLDEYGNLDFKVFSATQGFAVWDDEDRETSPAFVRFYKTYDINQNNDIEVIEFYTGAGIFTYNVDSSASVRFVGHKAYAYRGSEAVDIWGGRNPVIPFKFNTTELPLLVRVKELQDSLNKILSTFANQMEEDSRNTILVLKNYSGVNLGAVRAQLNDYGVIAVETIDGIDGGVETLKIEVNADNFRTILEVLRRAIIDNARGFDGKDERLKNNPNQMNIQSMYADMDLDAYDMETEFDFSFREVLELINHWQGGKFDPEDVSIIFDRDVMINESEAVDNYLKSGGQGLSQKTLTRNHPWDDGQEYERILKEEEERMASLDFYADAFKTDDHSDGVTGVEA